MAGVVTVVVLVVMMVWLTVAGPFLVTVYLRVHGLARSYFSIDALVAYENPVSKFFVVLVHHLPRTRINSP